MGIQGLAKVIADNTSGAMKEQEMKALFGRKVAVDASMSLYQFLIAVRSEGSNLTNEDGETTSHLSGMFYRTIRMVENGIKPLFVFDGKPPTLKSGELAKRTDRRREAKKKLEEAEAGDKEEVEKFSRRLVRVTPEHNEQCRKLLTLMGIPWMVAPCEAEAQCAELAKSGHVYATATEDMDALTFGTPRLLRHMTFSEARKMPIQEYKLSAVLEGLELEMDQFIDLCIMLGCDYLDSIRGVGPKRALELIREHKSLEKALPYIKKKYQVPEDWPMDAAKELFVKPDVTPGSEIPAFKWNAPDVDGLVQFLCKENGFQEDRIRRGAERLNKARTGTTQVRLDSFFSVLPKKPTKRKSTDNTKGKKKTKSTKQKRK